MKRQRGLLLLTATIEPSSSVPNLVRAGADVRRQDYRNAVDHYARTLSASTTQIVVAENSGADVTDLGAIARRHGHDLLAVSVPDRTGASARGKGNGEARLIEDALGQIADLTQYSYVAKLTGRIRLLNAGGLLRAQSGRYVSCRVRQDLDRIDSRFIVTDPVSALDFFGGLEPLIDEGKRRYFEHAALYRLMTMLYEQKCRWVRLGDYPRYQGVSGTAGSAYGGFTERASWPVKSLMHRLPWTDYR